MARLRRVIPSDTEDSGDSLPDLEVILSKHKTRNTGQTAKSTEANGSVAKNTSQKGNESSLRGNTQKLKEIHGSGDQERALACSMPKAQAADKPVKKQRVLKPMAWDATLLQKMPASELFMPEKPRRTWKDANASVSTGPLARIPAKIASADGNKREEEEEEEDVEESLWCGSDVTASEESDAMVQNSVKKETRRQGSTRSSLQSEKDTEPRLKEHEQYSRSTSQPIQDVIDLTTTPEPVKSSKPLKKIVGSAVPPPNIARPCSSSGNGHQAIHQYSPTRSHSPRKAPPTARPSTPPPPSSPSKSRLISPLKPKRIPSPPSLRPSLDAFWSADVVNAWNDTYSPAKGLISPKKSKSRSKAYPYDSDSDSFPSLTSSPRKGPGKRTAGDPTVTQARATQKVFAARKHELAESFLCELDETIAGGKIGELAASCGGVKILWSKKLNSTAGRANWRRETVRMRGEDGKVVTLYRHHASIELAEKVIDDEDRLLNVLAHEYCHLTTFMISNMRTNPHGAEFKSWATKVSRAFAARGVTVTTKHSYDIAYKYVWECVGCGHEFKRHSKSVDPTRHTCGKCKSTLVQTQPPLRKGKGGEGKGEYQGFVKENFQKVKKRLEERGEEAGMGKVMEALGKEYRELKDKAKMDAGIRSSPALQEVELAFKGLKVGEADV